MQVSIMERLGERAEVGFEGSRDALFELYLEEAKSRCVAFVDIERRIGYWRYRPAFEDGDIGLKALVSLERPYVSSHTPMALVILGPKAKLGSAPILVSSFLGRAFDRRNAPWGIRHTEGLVLPDEYKPEFAAYCHEVEAWLDGGTLPEASACGDHVLVDRLKFDYDHPYPRYYCTRARELREALARENAVPLSSLAQVIIPRRVRGVKDEVRVLKPGDFRYPLDVEGLRLGQATDVTLRAGDFIIVSAFDGLHTYRVREDPPVDVYAADHLCIVLRDLKVPADYLELYLGSETGRLIAEFNSVGLQRQMRPRDIGEIPVVPPRLGEEEYRRLVEVRHLASKDLSAISDARNSFEARIASYRDSIGADEQGVEEILDAELAENLKVYKRDLMREFLESDLNELNTCFAHGAYKATLILAGSILEAVLIDWLSEMHGRNYFANPYTVTDRRTGRERIATLADYINEIKEVEYPRWISEAQKAHEIREKRNLVHAKLCMDSDEINEETCRMVIDYLKDVLRTRGVS